MNGSGVVLLDSARVGIGSVTSAGLVARTKGGQISVYTNISTGGCHTQDASRSITSIGKWHSSEQYYLFVDIQEKKYVLLQWL